MDGIDTPSVAKLREVTSCPGFMAFSRVLGMRIANGRSLDAFRMLDDLGGPPELVHAIVDGWPIAVHPGLRELMSLEQYAAARLACFIPRFAAFDWPELLKRSVEYAAAVRSEESSR